MTEFDATLQEQQKKLCELKNQMAQIDAFFESQKKALNLTDEDMEALTRILKSPELQSVLEKAKNRAKA